MLKIIYLNGEEGLVGGLLVVRIVKSLVWDLSWEWEGRSDLRIESGWVWEGQGLTEVGRILVATRILVWKVEGFGRGERTEFGLRLFGWGGLVGLEKQHIYWAGTGARSGLPLPRSFDSRHTCWDFRLFESETDLRFEFLRLGSTDWNGFADPLTDWGGLISLFEDQDFNVCNSDGPGQERLKNVELWNTFVWRRSWKRGWIVGEPKSDFGDGFEVEKRSWIYLGLGVGFGLGWIGRRVGGEEDLGRVGEGKEKRFRIGERWCV